MQQKEGKGDEGKFEIKPLHPLFGAEVVGGVVGLEVFDAKERQVELLDALHKHKVLVLRNQQGANAEMLRKFSGYFGNLQVHLERNSHLDGFDDVNVVSNIRNPATGQFIGLYGSHVENFHSDSSYEKFPSKMTFLLSVIRPDGCLLRHINI